MFLKTLCWSCGDDEVKQCVGCERSYCVTCMLFHDCPSLLPEGDGYLVSSEFVDSMVKAGWAVPVPTPAESEAAMELVLDEDIMFMDALLKVRRDGG